MAIKPPRALPRQGVSLAHCSLYRATLNGVLRSVLCDTSTNGTYLDQAPSSGTIHTDKNAIGIAPGQARQEVQIL